MVVSLHCLELGIFIFAFAVCRPGQRIRACWLVVGMLTLFVLVLVIVLYQLVCLVGWLISRRKADARGNWQEEEGEGRRLEGRSFCLPLLLIDSILGQDSCGAVELQSCESMRPL
jgi:hypothetical protein